MRATRKLFVGKVKATLECLVDLTSVEKEAKDGCGMGSFMKRIGTALILDTVVDKVLSGMGTSFTVSIKEEHLDHSMVQPAAGPDILALNEVNSRNVMVMIIGHTVHTLCLHCSASSAGFRCHIHQLHASEPHSETQT